MSSYSEWVAYYNLQQFWSIFPLRCLTCVLYNCSCSNSYIHHQNSNLYLYYYQGVHSTQVSLHDHCMQFLHAHSPYRVRYYIKYSIATWYHYVMQLSSWVVTVMLFFLSIWNCILMIVYMRKQRKVLITQHQHEEISSNSSSELGEAANLLEKERPFTNH